MANQLNILQVQEIMALLPHRYPFLLIDRVLDYTPGESLTALKNVTINEPIFTGHFPGLPIFPGVLILEAMKMETEIRAVADGVVVQVHITAGDAVNTGDVLLSFA